MLVARILALLLLKFYSTP